MPCYDWKDDEPISPNPELIKRLNAATRAACDLYKALKGMYASEGVIRDLPVPTLQWVQQHIELDKKHAKQKRRK